MFGTADFYSLTFNCLLSDGPYGCLSPYLNKKSRLSGTFRATRVPGSDGQIVSFKIQKKVNQLVFVSAMSKDAST